MKRCGSSEGNEKSIWNLNVRTVLVVADLGVGKSSTTTQVEWHTKLADPTRWVVRINWNGHSGKLQVIGAATFNFDSLFELVCSAVFTKSKYTDINRYPLKQAVQNCGSITVLMEGFDEISPIHVYKPAVIFFDLMKTKFRRDLVTLRNVQKERLEEELSGYHRQYEKSIT